MRALLLLPVRNGINQAYFTGSYPPSLKGWQRIIRHKAMKEPRKAPWHFMASMAYWEQVGVKRQAGGNRGEIKT